MKYSHFTSACVMQPYRGRLMIVARRHEKKKTNIFCTLLYVDFIPSDRVHARTAPNPTIGYLSQTNFHCCILLLLYNQ